MAKISISHVSWRDGRPRFNPGDILRNQGHKGFDLRHKNQDGTLGPWFSKGEAVDWSDRFCAEIATRRQQDKAASSRRNPQAGRSARPPSCSIRKMVHTYFNIPAHAGVSQQKGKRKIKAKSPATIKDYKTKMGLLEIHDPALYDAAVVALTPAIINGLFESLWEERGLATAKGIIGTLSAIITWSRKRGILGNANFANPCLGLMLAAPAPNVRPAEPFEIEALVNAADAMGLPQIGDMIVFGVWSGQRQSDRLVFDKAQTGERIEVRQSKTGAHVSLPYAPQLKTRLKAADKRRRDAGIINPRLILNEASWIPYGADYYRHQFMAVRETAINGSKPLRLKPCPSLASFKEKNLRDTAVTFLARAGNDIPHICAVSGHSLQSATRILKHYLATDAGMADEALEKMGAWYDKQENG